MLHCSLNIAHHPDSKSDKTVIYS